MKYNLLHRHSDHKLQKYKKTRVHLKLRVARRIALFGCKMLRYYVTIRLARPICRLFYKNTLSCFYNA